MTKRAVRLKALLRRGLPAMGIVALGLWTAGNTGGQVGPIRVSVPSPFASCRARPASSAPLIYRNSEVEPRVAVDPRTLGSGVPRVIGVWQQDRRLTAGALGLMAGTSLDGGRTWTRSTLPFTHCLQGGPPFDAASDPWVSIGPDGTAYASGLLLNDSVLGPNTEIAVVTSVDGGRSWGTFRLLTRDHCCGLDDKEMVLADPVHAGRAYAVWSSTLPGGSGLHQPAFFSRTDDGGRTWSLPRTITARSGATLGNELIADPSRHLLYNIFSGNIRRPHECLAPLKECEAGSADGEIDVIVSSDLGNTWSALHRISLLRAVSGGVAIDTVVRTGTRVPDAAVDGGGRLYVVWQDSRVLAGNHDIIVLSVSDDRGVHWSRQLRLGPPGITSVTPGIAVDGTGTIGVTYYTLRKDPNRSGAVLADYWFRASTDRGRSFGPQRHLAGPFNIVGAPWSDGFFVGDYEGIASRGHGFQLLYSLANSPGSADRADLYAEGLDP